jgi:hypothetical protein
MAAEREDLIRMMMLQGTGSDASEESSYVRINCGKGGGFGPTSNLSGRRQQLLNQREVSFGNDEDSSSL